MPTAQARSTQTCGLHATRSSIRSDNYTSSLPERRTARRFFLFRWHRAHTRHPLTFRTATSADRYSLVPRRVCLAWPVMDTCARPGSRWARLPHAGLAGNRALCAFLLCKSCFIRDTDLCGGVWQLSAVHALLALSWAHMRVWKAAGSCRTLPQRSISRIKHDIHRRNAHSARFPANPACASRAQRLPRRAHVSMTGRAVQTRLGTRRPSVGGGRCPEI